MTAKSLVLVVSVLLPLLSVPLCADQPNLSLTLRDHPCRVFDSRTDRALQDNEIAIISLAPEFSVLQGGVAGCGVPSDAKAVKLNIKGQSVVFDGGYFRVFNAQGAGNLGTYTSLQLASPGRFVNEELDLPVAAGLQVGIHTLKSAHAIVDVVGYYTQIPLTGIVAGVVTAKNWILGTETVAVVLSLDNSIKVVCDSPRTNHLYCDAAQIGSSIIASGEVLNFGSGQEHVLYAIGTLYTNPGSVPPQQSSTELLGGLE